MPTIKSTVWGMKTFIFCTMDGFRRAFDFKGRTRRRNHWLFALGAYLTYVLSFFVFALIMRLLIVFNTGIIGSIFVWIFTAFSILLLLFCLVAYVSSVIRRIHDSGKSGWFYLVPFYNFYLLVRKGDVEANKWGDPN